MNTIQEVQEYLKREMQIMHTPLAPERMMAQALEDLAATCQTVEEFTQKAQKIRVTGAGIEEVQIANEYREIVLDTIAS